MDDFARISIGIPPFALSLNLTNYVDLLLISALGPIHHKVLDPREVNYYRKKEREKAEEKLDQYLLICRELKVLFPSFNYLYHEPPVIRSFLCIS